MPKGKPENPPDSPKQCPCGHKHISWTVDEDDVFCWDCNKKYPLVECFGRKASASFIRRGMEQLPLFSYNRHLPDSKDEVQTPEKRHHSRAEATFAVLVEKSHGLFMNGKTKNISYGGAFIRCLEPLQPNEVFQIEFSGAHLDHRMKATAEVIWSNIRGYDEEVESSGMGVRFTEISPEARTIISGLLSNSPDTEHQEETLHT